MKRVFVSGASGFLGVNTIIALQKNGYAVTAFLRDAAKLTVNDSSNITIVEGDLRDKTSVSNALNGCTYIVHAAAETDQGLLSANDYFETNVLTTRILYEAAVEQKIERVIHVSTSNVFDYGDAICPGDESKPSNPPFTSSFYVQSKIAAHHLALSYADHMDMLLVSPTFMVGPNDRKPSSGKLIQYCYNRKIIFYPPGGKNFVDVRDVASAIVHLLTAGENNQAYILAGENLSYRQFFKKVNTIAGIRAIYIPLPKPIMLLIGFAGNQLRRFGIKTAYNTTNMQILSIHNYYSSAKIQNTLGFRFKPIDDAISEAIHWMRAHKLLRRSSG